jgi:hypothetical protein
MATVPDMIVNVTVTVNTRGVPMQTFEEWLQTLVGHQYFSRENIALRRAGWDSALANHECPPHVDIPAFDGKPFTYTPPAAEEPAS